MDSIEKINERILHEIDISDANKDIKKFLKEILLFELDIMDQGKPTFKDKYIEIIDNIFS